MDRNAVIKASGKLQRMQEAYLIFSTSTDMRQASSAWIDFVMASGSFYSSLEQGAKVNSISRYWFGTKKHDRKTDPLLKYLYAARNSEEHGLTPIVRQAAKEIHLTERGSAVQLVSDGKNWNVEHIAGKPPVFKDPALALQRAYDDRSKIWCELPTSHLGNPMTDLNPKAVAELALNYFKAVLDEALELAK
jgi:hypothetical protein